jgi:hypothetical protein
VIFAIECTECGKPRHRLWCGECGQAFPSFDQSSFSDFDLLNLPPLPIIHPQWLSRITYEASRWISPLHSTRFSHLNQARYQGRVHHAQARLANPYLCISDFLQIWLSTEQYQILQTFLNQCTYEGPIGFNHTYRELYDLDAYQERFALYLKFTRQAHISLKWMIDELTPHFDDDLQNYTFLLTSPQVLNTVDPIVEDIEAEEDSINSFLEQEPQEPQEPQESQETQEEDSLPPLDLTRIANELNHLDHLNRLFKIWTKEPLNPWRWT